MGLVVQNLPASAGDTRDTSSIPESERSSGVGNGNPLQYPCLENSMGRGGWRAIVHVAMGPQRVGHDWVTKHKHKEHKQSCGKVCVAGNGGPIPTACRPSQAIRWCNLGWLFPFKRPRTRDLLGDDTCLLFWAADFWIIYYATRGNWYSVSGGKQIIVL